MAYLDELKAMVEELEALVASENKVYEDRGVPMGQPLVATEGDEEVEAMIAKRLDYDRRWEAFKRQYWPDKA